MRRRASDLVNLAAFPHQSSRDNGEVVMIRVQQGRQEVLYVFAMPGVRRIPVLTLFPPKPEKEPEKPTSRPTLATPPNPALQPLQKEKPKPQPARAEFISGAATISSGRTREDGLFVVEQGEVAVTVSETAVLRFIFLDPIPEKEKVADRELEAV